MNTYTYEGPVFSFNNCISNCWKSSTIAISEKKARNNLMFQFKKNNNMCSNTKIVLTGVLTLTPVE